MRHDDCGSDFLQQSDDCIAVEDRCIGRRNRRQLRGIKLIKYRITRRPFSGPLRVQPSLRPKLITLGRDEPALDVLEVRWSQWAICLRLIRRAAPARLVYDVNRVTLPQEVLSPTFPTIRRSREVRSGLTESVNHQKRPTMGLFSWDLVLGVDLAAQDLLPVDRRVLPSSKQIALAFNRYRQIFRIQDNDTKAQRHKEGCCRRSLHH